MTNPNLRADPQPVLQLQTAASATAAATATDHAAIAAQLERYGIETLLKPSYQWSGFRYSNATDAIAAAKLGATRAEVLA
jgi:hypothetical protein